MTAQHFSIDLVRRLSDLPVPWEPPRARPRPEPPPGEQAVAALLDALDLLVHRGPGAATWATSFRHDPIAFLLDSASDAIRVWSLGQVIYANRAAARLDLGPRAAVALEVLALDGVQLERRCLRFHRAGREYLLEIVHEM